MEDIYDSNKKVMTIIAIFVIFITLSCIGFCYYSNIVTEKREQVILEQERILNEQLRKENLLKVAIENVEGIFDENRKPRDDISSENLLKIIDDINLIEDEEFRNTLIDQVREVQEYKNIGEKINNIFIDGILISNYNVEDIDTIKTEIASIKEEWQVPYLEIMKKIDNQISIINSADKKVKSLFSDTKFTKIKQNINRKKYNDAKNAVNKIVQNDIKKKYNEYLDSALKFLEEKEEEARKAEEERMRKEAEIKAAWVIVNTPYISQTNNKIYNGCEAAALLMGLQHKGQLKGTSLKTFVDNMPKSEDDPHQGFVRDIYGYEPRDVPHWIAPDALAKYGRQYYSNVFDITGTSVDGLKKELDKGNPVVFYATGGNFADPVNWTEEVPKNVHVMLLIGYNPKSKQMLINDPWTKTSDGRVYISESRFTTIYNIIGKKAVVIR